jgi:hypothetical protein
LVAGRKGRVTDKVFCGAEPENNVSFVVAAGTTTRTTSVQPIATGTNRTTGTTTTGFGVLNSFRNWGAGMPRLYGDSASAQKTTGSVPAADNIGGRIEKGRARAGRQ